MDCGMGLSNIVSRIDSLNGTFDITSQKGHGMHATAVINVSAPREEAKKHRKKGGKRA